METSECHLVIETSDPRHLAQNRPQDLSVVTEKDAKQTLSLGNN